MNDIENLLEALTELESLETQAIHLRDGLKETVLGQALTTVDPSNFRLSNFNFESVYKEESGSISVSYRHDYQYDRDYVCLDLSFNSLTTLIKVGWVVIPISALGGFNKSDMRNIFVCFTKDKHTQYIEDKLKQFHQIEIEKCRIRSEEAEKELEKRRIKEEKAEYLRLKAKYEKQ